MSSATSLDMNGSLLTDVTALTTCVAEAELQLEMPYTAPDFQTSRHVVIPEEHSNNNQNYLECNSATCLETV